MAKAVSKKYINLFIKILSWTLGTLVVLCILLFVLVQIPAVQNYAKDQTVSWLNWKLKTKVSIAKLRINFPNQILIEKIYFEDQHKDSLLWGNQISVDISLFKLLQNKIEIKSIGLSGVTVNIKRVSPDTVFNFNYILAALATEKSKGKQKTDTSKSLGFSFGKLDLKNISVRYIDDVSGINTNVFLNSLQTSVKEFDLDKSLYGISDLKVVGLNLKIDRHHPLMVLHAVAKTASNSQANSALPELIVGKINFSDAKIKYDDALVGIHSILDANQLLLQMGKMDLNKLIIPIDWKSVV